MIAGKQFFGPHPFTPGLGKWEVLAGPPGLLLLQPPLHPPFFPGAGLFHPVSRQQSGAPGGTSFPEEPAGGEQGGEGEGRGRGQDPAGGDGDGVGTSWKTRPRAAQQFAKSGLSGACLRVRPGGAGARGPRAAAWWAARDMPRTPRRTPPWLFWLRLLRTLRLDRPTP